MYEVFSTLDQQEISIAGTTARFFGGKCYRGMHKHQYQYWAVISKESMTDEQIIAAILEYAGSGSGLTAKQIRLH